MVDHCSRRGAFYCGGLCVINDKYSAARWRARLRGDLRAPGASPPGPLHARMKPLVIYIRGSRLMCKTLFAALLLLQNIGQREILVTIFALLVLT